MHGAGTSLRAFGCTPFVYTEEPWKLLARLSRAALLVGLALAGKSRGAGAVAVRFASAGDTAQVRREALAASSCEQIPRIHEDGVCYFRTCYGKLCRHKKSPAISAYVRHEDATSSAFVSRSHECPRPNVLHEAPGPDRATSSAATAAQASPRTSVAGMDVRTMLGMRVNIDGVPSRNKPTSSATPQAASEDALTTQPYGLWTCPGQPPSTDEIATQAYLQASPRLGAGVVSNAQTAAVQQPEMLEAAPTSPGDSLAPRPGPSGSKRTLADYGFRAAAKGRLA